MRPLRWGMTLLAAVLGLWVAWAAWQTWHVSQSLSAAADDAASLQTSIDAGDDPGVDRALASLQEHADDADARTSGQTWALLTHAPMYGDDARGVRVVSGVLADLTDEGFQQLADSATDLDAYLPRDGRIPLDSLAALQDPVTRASDAFAEADRRLAREDDTGYVDRLRTNYEELAGRVSDADKALATARTALDLLPTMLGGDGPRDYLMVFQNNAEVRASGGMPGAWALVHAEDGALSIPRQGTAGDFPSRDGAAPILPISAEEEAIYGSQLGSYFQDANFTPDFPRSAELWSAWWAASFPGIPLDGVVSLDPVAMSYLLGSTGPVEAGGVQLTADNAVQQLLSTPYLAKDPQEQNTFFAEAARATFTAVTGSLRSPNEFLHALVRAADEGRLRLVPADPDEQARLAGSEVAGALTVDNASAPQVAVTVNDATGSKMSYYLRYRASVEARSCARDGHQELLGTMSLNQSVPAAEAAELPVSVTGGGLYGTAPGRQLVIVRIYGPVDGSVADLKLDGAAIDSEPVVIDGRPITLVVVELSGPDDVLLTWAMNTGPDQTGTGAVSVTPSVVPGDKGSTIKSACR